MPERSPVQVPDRSGASARTTDLVLYHHAAEETWTAQLAERIRTDVSANRHLVAQLATWDFSGSTDIPAEAEKCLRGSRFLGIVVSSRMLREDWPALEKLILVLSDLGLAKGRVVAILKENVTMPPFLRLKEWIDFRESLQFEESARDLLVLLREDLASPERNARRTIGSESRESAESAWKKRPLFVRVKKASERIVSNLFPVVEIPKEIFSAEARFQKESEIVEACGGPGPLPFLLKGSRLYTVSPLTETSVFAPALKEGGKPSQERFTQWLADPERAPWAIELLNHSLRYHAWKRGMSFDQGQNLFYFTRSKPKNLWWEIGGRIVQREVTAPHMKWNQAGNQMKAEAQYGWRHEAIRAGFLQILGTLFLRLEPAWFLTELDGKTPSTAQPVGPLDPFPPKQEINGQALRTLLFWSAVFAKGHRELRIDAGTNPIRVRLTPASGCGPSAISNDRMDFDALALTGIDDAQMIQELGPINA